MDNSHGKDIPENLQVSILMKGLKPSFLSLVMPKKPQTLEDMRQAMVLAEQTANASASKSINCVDSTITNELMCLRNQLSEVLAFQKDSREPPQQQWMQQQQPQQQQTWQQHQQQTWQQPQQQPSWRQTTQRSQYRTQPQYQQQNSPGYQQPFHCGYCGGKRFHIRKDCPASGQLCNNCGKIGHFQGECKGARRQNRPNQR